MDRGDWPPAKIIQGEVLFVICFISQFCLQDIVVHGIEYAGESWGDKVARLREALLEAGHGGMVVSELDEINWLLNIRGEGSSHNEVRTLLHYVC